MARSLVTRYGMTEDFDMVALETVNNAYLGGDASLACSEQTASRVDAKVVEIVQEQHKKAYKLLADNRRKLDEIAQYLYEKETISGEEFMRILNAQPQLPAAAPADSFLCGRIPDYIKIDVEGAENEAIDGCRGAMSHSPDLKIAVYHRSRDIFDIPMKIHGINPDYRMFLRKAPSVPGWDVDLVCTVR